MDNTNLKNRKYFPLLDLLKWIAAMFVVSLHCFPSGLSAPSVNEGANNIPMFIGQAFMHPILRIGVPIFFIISSFLLFRKTEQNPENKWTYIKKFVIRTSLLYLFWYIVGLFPTISDTINFANKGQVGEIFRYFLLSFIKGAPRGFWYLGMLILSVLITSLIKNKKTFIILFVLSGVLYIYGVFNSAYFNIFNLANNPVSKFFYWVGDYFDLNISLLTALIYVVIGKYIATRENINIKAHIPLLIINFFLMVGEMFLVQYFNLFVYPDAFFFLPTFAFLLVTLLMKYDVKNEKFLLAMSKLRKVGSFLYLFHFQFFFYFYGLFDLLKITVFKDNLVLIVIPYILVILLAALLQTLFEKLSKYKYLRFLKYSF